MPIDKIAFRSLEHPQQLPQAKKEEVKNVPNDKLSLEDKEKSNASKYMIGAAALAGVIAIGIIGHKNNWWRKAQDIGESLSKNGSDAAQGGERKLGQTGSETHNRTPNEGNGSNHVPSGKNQNSVPGQGREVNSEIIDFSKLEGERSVRDGMHVVAQKGENGKLLREYISEDNKTISEVLDYDPATGKLIKKTGYWNDDGKTINWIDDYDPATGKLIKETKYWNDGKTISFVTDYDPATGKLIKDTDYCGKRIWRVTDYDPATGNEIKWTEYYDDGKTIKKVKETDPLTHKLKITNYDRDGNVINVEEE